MLFAVCRSPFAVGARTNPSAWIRRPFRCANSLDKSRQHLFDVRRRTFKDLGLLWSEKSQILRQQNETNQLVGRTGGDVQKLPQFGAGRSSTSLGDIGRDGSRGSSHLAGQAKSLRIGKRSRRAVDTQRQSLTALPHLQFPEVLHLLAPFSVSRKHATLAQEYFKNQVQCDLLCLTKLTFQVFVSPPRVAFTANGERQTANPSGELPC